MPFQYRHLYRNLAVLLLLTSTLSPTARASEPGYAEQLELAHGRMLFITAENLPSRAVHSPQQLDPTQALIVASASIEDIGNGQPIYSLVELTNFDKPAEKFWLHGSDPDGLTVFQVPAGRYFVSKVQGNVLKGNRYEWRDGQVIDTKKTIADGLNIVGSAISNMGKTTYAKQRRLFDWNDEKYGAITVSPGEVVYAGSIITHGKRFAGVGHAIFANYHAQDNSEAASAFLSKRFPSLASKMTTRLLKVRSSLPAKPANDLSEFYTLEITRGGRQSRTAAYKKLSRSPQQSDALYELIAAELMAKASITEAMDRGISEELAWAAKALAASDREKYQATLQQVIRENPNRKVRRHAKAALAAMQNRVAR